MGKQTAEEIRKEVLDEDSKKDVSIYMSIPIGVIAGIASIGAVCAVIMMRALLYFRQGIDAYWLSCTPFLFPVITGLFAAYKKQFGLLGVHLAVTMLAMLMGGFGFGLSVEPIFLNRHDCIPVSNGLPCDKASLSYMYVISGSVAAGFSILGFLVTLCGLYSATKRINERERQAELRHLQDVEKHQKELRQMKMHEERKPRTLSMTSQRSHPQSPAAPTAPNGIPQQQPQPQTQTQPQVPSGQATQAKSNTEGDNVTTKL